SNEVGGSYHMELEGLKRSLELLKERGVTLDCIVTDRHLQIQKFLRESSITQFFDVWHIEKDAGNPGQPDNVHTLEAGRRGGTPALVMWTVPPFLHIQASSPNHHLSPAALAFGSDQDYQIDIINELDLANATYGITQVTGLHNSSKAFLFRGAAGRECGKQEINPVGKMDLGSKQA
ncbi:hypothetical protein JOQ06_009653, partial [Pogonophryne albipinna]